VSGAPADMLEDLRPAAFAIAYRMLGSVSEAEDIAQEALLRVHHVLGEGEEIESPRAYLATVTTRLAIDELRSARARRERYVGEWLPEPLLSGGEDDPAHHAELADSLSLAFLVLLESLSPEQRAALLLHDVFDYGYDEVARIVGKSEAATRQLASRARHHVDVRRPRFQASPERQEELARRFFAAARAGEVAELEALLVEDVELHGDGGGKAPAIARPLYGRRRVARTLTAWVRHAGRLGVEIRPVELNGRPGALGLDREGRVLFAMALEAGETGIEFVHSVVNPDKLRHLRPAGL
jgi:RNA polymerase sigma-70 factor (TIGR02957 family)